MIESASLPNADAIVGRINELKAKLEVNAPGYELLLFQIHKQLHDDEAVVHLLTEEQIGVIVSGLKRKTNTVIVSAQAGKKSEKAKLKTASLEDI